MRPKASLQLYFWAELWAFEVVLLIEKVDFEKNAFKVVSTIEKVDFEKNSFNVLKYPYSQAVTIINWQLVMDENATF